MNESLLIIGGSNIDYIATSKDKIQNGVSNIGTISISFGGVARNICENLVRLGAEIDFITAIGNDLYGENIKNNLVNLGVNVIFPKVDLPTSSYLAINDNNHDLALSICDNRIIDELNSTFLSKYYDFILEHEYIILDANLNEDALKYIFSNFSDKKIIVDAISPAKVLKFKNYLDKIYLLKCNKFEAKALIQDYKNEEELISKILNLGVKNIVVSFGASDIYYGNKSGIGFVKNDLVKDFVNTSGCGDALTSGIIDQYIRSNKSLKDSIIFGNKLSKVTLMTSSATSIEISKYSH